MDLRRAASSRPDGGAMKDESVAVDKRMVTGDDASLPYCPAVAQESCPAAPCTGNSSLPESNSATEN
jgi:hypothetical protein